MRGNGVFGQDWLLQFSFLYVLIKMSHYILPCYLAGSIWIGRPDLKWLIFSKVGASPFYLIYHSLYLCVGKLRVFFPRFLFFLLLRFSWLLELDKEELLLEEVEVELFIFCFLLFILQTFLRPLFSLSFSGVLVICIWSLLLDSISTSAIILSVLPD